MDSKEKDRRKIFLADGLLPSIENETELKTKLLTPIGKTSKRKTYVLNKETNEITVVDKELPFDEQFTEDITTGNLNNVEKYLVKELLSIGQLLQMISLQSGLDLEESIVFAKNLAFTHCNVSKSDVGFMPWVVITQRHISQAKQDITTKEAKEREGFFFKKGRE